MAAHPHPRSFLRTGLALLLVASLGVGCTVDTAEGGDTSAAGAATEGLSEAERAALPDREGVLFWSPDEQITGYRNIEHIAPVREIRTGGGQPFPLRADPVDLSGVTYEVDGDSFTLDQHVEQHRVAGLLVLQGDRILLERYTLGNDENSRWISFSIAKSVVSMLIGAAIRDGYIASVDDPVTKYLPQLAGAGYDGVSIRNVLRMSSGVSWNEDYADPESDVALMPQGDLAMVTYMQALGTEAAPGERFNYNTGETNMAGHVLRAAIGNNLSTYLERKIWQPFGMESDAIWMLHEPFGGEFGGCCISATLRDYGRLGLFAMRGGVLPDGTEVLAPGWMNDSTSPSPAYDGYGYFWWLRGNGVFSGIGIFGQLLYMDPRSEVVVVTHSAWPQATGEALGKHRWAFVEAVAAEVAGAGLPEAAAN